MLREQFSCFAIDLTPSPLRAITRISTASSWVNIDGTKKAVILVQVGHFYFGAVGQYYFGGNIRQAVAADAEAIYAVHMASIRTLGASHYSAAQLEAWCGERSAASYLAPIATKVVVVAERGNTISGFGQLDPDAQAIEAIYVSPSAARKGIGSAILRELEHEAMSLLLPRLTLDASLNAQEFYAVHGYVSATRTEHELRPGVFLPCVKMNKVLHVSEGA